MPEERGQASLEPEAFEARYGWLREADVLQVLTQLAFGTLGDRRIQVLEQRKLTWRCRCSRERSETALLALGPDTLQSMVDEDHGAEVTCDFCQTTYVFTEDELVGIRGRALPTS